MSERSGTELAGKRTRRRNLCGGALFLTTAFVIGCADTAPYNLRIPAAAQADRYVEAEGLDRLTSKKVAIVSFGVEFDTTVTYPSAACHGYQLPAASTPSVTFGTKSPGIFHGRTCNR